MLNLQATEDGKPAPATNVVVVSTEYINRLAEEARTNNPSLRAAGSRVNAAEFNAGAVRTWEDPMAMVGGTLVANLNTDMFLPLFPLKSLIVQGLEESDLANDLKRIARPMAVEVLSDPEPERNAFVRSDQYSFIRTGVPALSLKVGFTRDSPEHQIVRKWRTERYHAPSDDLNQPVDLKAAEDFGRVYLAVVREVANRPTRPKWNDDSFFRRFAR